MPVSVLFRNNGLNVVIALFLLTCISIQPAAGQSRLRLVNNQTKVSKISFKFVDHQSFEESRLKAQIATAEPGFFSRLQDFLPLLDGKEYPFSPVELQKDVVRLQHFYNRNGFLHPEIDYLASQLDTTSNEIHVIFTIEEGPPVIIQDVGFFGVNGEYAFYQFEPGQRELWIKFRDNTTVRTGDRYSEFDRIRIRDEVQAWLNDRGYAFARVEAEAEIDSLRNTADLAFTVDPGPLAYFGDITVEGNNLVDSNVIIRELPFKRGDLFSNRKLSKAQQELFALSLFRVALTSIPEQPRDSTVDVLIRVRETRPRYVTAETGYGREQGVQLQGEWTHRNFLGGARTLSLNAWVHPGYFARTIEGALPIQLYRGTVVLRQPYLFSTNLSGSVAPFVEYQRSSLGVASREIGLNTSVLYQIFPFRTVSIQHTYSRVLQRTPPSEANIDTERDPFDKSVLSASAILGKVDDFLNPTEGFLVLPFAEAAGAVLGSAIDYIKVGTQVTGYLPLTERIQVAGRFFGGRIWLQGMSRDAFLGKVPRLDSLLFENRFDPILFYLGGPDDLRGWNRDLAGEKIAVRVPVTNDTTYEALGGLNKIAANIELRMPFPGLGPSWRSAVFLDGGVVGDPPFSFNEAPLGAGLGIRYRTPVGYIRIDLAYKLRASFADLRSPEVVYLLRRGLLDEDPGAEFLRRFNFHINIGQAF